jgi:hypothetical protein
MEREITMMGFIDAYCTELSDMLGVETKQDTIDTNFTATEFNGLMEVAINTLVPP